jgi:hypothetical protein
MNSSSSVSTCHLGHHFGASGSPCGGIHWYVTIHSAAGTDVIQTFCATSPCYRRQQCCASWCIFLHSIFIFAYFFQFAHEQTPRALLCSRL